MILRWRIEIRKLSTVPVVFLSSASDNMNIVMAMNMGGVTIRISPEKILSISDTGIGIAPEDLPRIFEKGFTGYNGRSDKKSTGLGLYLCRQTADKLELE
jgi:signal transduction histidine kinase